MDYYRIEYKKKAVKELRKLPINEIKKIQNRIISLKNNPYPEGVKKLRGAELLFRIRSGDYRIIYGVSVKEKLVTIQYIRNRKDV